MATSQRDPVNKEAVRMLVAQIGYNEASKRIGIKPGTLRQWALREQWNRSVTHSQAVTTVTTRPADALAAAIAEDNTPTRAALSKAHRKAAEHAKTLSGSELLKPGTAQALRHHGAGASVVHGWEEKQQQTNVMVNIALLGVQPSEVQIDAVATAREVVNPKGTDDASGH